MNFIQMLLVHFILLICSLQLLKKHYGLSAELAAARKKKGEEGKQEVSAIIKKIKEKMMDELMGADNFLQCSWPLQLCMFSAITLPGMAICPFFINKENLEFSSLDEVLIFSLSLGGTLAYLYLLMSH